MRVTDRPTTEFWRLIHGWNQSQPIVLNQTQLGTLFGVKKSFVGDWKFGDAWPGLGTLGRIADKTGIPYETLAKAIEADKKRLAVAPTRAKKAPVARGDKGNQKRARGS